MNKQLAMKFILTVCALLMIDSVLAEETQSPIMTALTSTTISGYVDSTGTFSIRQPGSLSFSDGCELHDYSGNSAPVGVPLVFDHVPNANFQAVPEPSAMTFMSIGSAMLGVLLYCRKRVKE